MREADVGDRCVNIHKLLIPIIRNVILSFKLYIWLSIQSRQWFCERKQNV